MASYNRGMDFLKSQRDAMPSYGDRLRKLWLKNGDTAQFYYLWDLDEAPVILTHLQQKQRKGGGKPFNIDVLCGRDSINDDPTKCQFCLQGEKGPYLSLVMPVWVELIIHQTKPEGNVVVKPVVIKGTETQLWREDVNAIWLFPMRSKLQQQLMTYIATGGDPIDPKPVDTILNNAFRYTVTGVDQQKLEIIEAKVDLKTPDAARDAQKNRPDIDALILNEYGKPGGTTSGSSKATSGATVSYQDAPAVDEDVIVGFD